MPPARYLMLVRELDATLIANQPRPSLTVIQPDGGFTTEELPLISYSYPKKNVNATVRNLSVDSTATWIRRQRYARNYIYQLEIKKINELSIQGWELFDTISFANGASVQYLFRRTASR